MRPKGISMTDRAKFSGFWDVQSDKITSVFILFSRSDTQDASKWVIYGSTLTANQKPLQASTALGYSTLVIRNIPNHRRTGYTVGK